MSSEPLLAELDRAWRKNLVVLESPPTRFLINLGESCNLRCAHCITSAPELTASGRARDMDHAVLDALGPHLAHALWVGLSHAGEPSVAPMLLPLLQRLQQERRGQPSVVHMLSNGHSLDEARLCELAELGLSSLSISIDGMSLASHDALRIGSRVDRLLARIEALSAERRRRFPDLRIGLSLTLTRANLSELPALIEFVKGAALDWIKLEELVPVSPVAASWAPAAEAQRVALAQARQHADALGVALLDHSAAPQVWKCRLEEEPEMARFSALDDRANRSQINPCRLPWELVCVEPNGDIKPADFHHPAAGNLRSESLSAIWNGPRFVLERSRSMRERLCRIGPISCQADPGPASW